MKDIVCDGYFCSSTNKYEIGMSEIYSQLIRDCGRFVESYNSDILIDIRQIDNAIAKNDCETYIFWIGFRENGVDGLDFIKCRCDTPYFYRKMYKLTIEKDGKKCIATLSKRDVYDFKKENIIED